MIRYLSSPYFILVVLLFVIIMAISAAFLFEPEEFPKSRTNVFISILASVTVILIGLSLAVSSVTLHEAESLIRVYATKQAVDKLWLLPNKMLSTSTKARPLFLASFYPNNLYLRQACSRESTETYTSCISVLEEQNIAIVMIQSWEDFLTTRKLDATGDAVWTNNFIQWAQSAYLKEYFDLLKYNFKETTIAFGNILFKYAAMIPSSTSNPEIYRQTVQQLLKDPTYLQLIDFLSKEEKTYVTI